MSLSNSLTEMQKYIEPIQLKLHQLYKVAVHVFWSVSHLLGIQWAPSHIPRERRLQTLAAAGWICLVLFGEIIAVFLFIKLLYSSYWWVALLYAAWMLNDIEVANKGGRLKNWVRNWAWWRYYRDYFPLKLVKTKDLDPSRNYLFACFPHGVVCTGAFGAFATNALGFDKLFPGMTCNMITLGGHFLFPFFRDLILALGGCSAASESLMYILDLKRHRGRCVALFVGGAAEALDSHPGEYKVVLSRRKGFIRIAMKSGAPLVPVFSFGETDVFRPLNNPENSLLRKIQETVKRWTGVSPLLPLGRGILQYTYGVVPLRAPITTVVGEPMEVKQNLDPSDEEVDIVHAQFTDRLINLFETQKSKYLKNHENVKLVIT